jgi:hypothetical protein
MLRKLWIAKLNHRCSRLFAPLAQKVLAHRTTIIPYAAVSTIILLTSDTMTRDIVAAITTAHHTIVTCQIEAFMTCKSLETVFLHYQIMSDVRKIERILNHPSSWCLYSFVVAESSAIETFSSAIAVYTAVF